MKKLVLLCLMFFMFQNMVFGQTRKPKPQVKDTLSSQAFQLMVEQSLESFYAEYANKANFNKVIDQLEADGTKIPEFTDDEICNHLKKMNELSHFHLDCNQITLTMIRFFQKNRRSFLKICLGRSKLYFDMYEESLTKYDLPIVLRFLSVIESGLRPQVKSPAGALGLWQFMYGTGKMYGLQENSHLDERMDPRKSTDAACRYLKKLFDIYGDWNLALAAYNAGPGNVNKAIRRSGGKRTYWEVRPFLPRETQGYVPNFIAAAYLMTFYNEHNLMPMESTYHVTQIDTMCFRSGVHMETISSLITWDLEEIKRLNPVYKRTYIPETVPKQCLAGPLSKIGKLVSLEDSLYALEKTKYGTALVPPSVFILPTLDTSNTSNQAPLSTNYLYHKVKKGETLSKIAARYKVSNSELISWNNLNSTRVPAGKVLKIIQKAVLDAEQSPQKNKTISPNPTYVKSDSVVGLVYYDTLVVVYHSVQRNETLESIAKIYNVTKEDIKAWNNLQDQILNINQRLKINTKVQLSKPGMVFSKSKPEEPKPVVKTKPLYYTVKSGDLFNRIAQKYGMTVAELQRLNPSVNPDRITVGQRLKVK
jgi:membrane-bound lytic murein transglycosylase D